MKKEKSKHDWQLRLLLTIIVVLLLVIGVGGYYFFLADKEEKENEVSNSINEDNSIIENEGDKNDNVANINPYKKYESLNWKFKYAEKDVTKLEFDNKKIQLENGIAYLYYENSKTEITSVKGYAEKIGEYGVQTLAYVYILTEDGTIWKSDCNSINGLNANFNKVNFNEKVVDITNGNSNVRITEAPYFLLANGELINEMGSKYEELDGDFTKSIIINIDERIFIKKDNTMYIYNNETRRYMQIKDEKGKAIKMENAFIQWSSTYNNLLEETGGTDRAFIITENNKLFYMDEYLKAVAKEYKETTNKIIEKVREEEQKTEYGGSITNIIVSFTDGTERTFKNTHRNFLEDSN